jgi:hypothetical protein
MRRGERGARHESDVLLRQLDGHLAGLRLAREDMSAAEQVAAALRQLIIDTASSSAADRARVRAAVHLFILRREARGRQRPPRGHRDGDSLRMVNELLGTLGRGDLAVGPVPVPEPA